MKYMTSTSTNNGLSTIVVTFVIGRAPDLAAVDVQNRVQQALGRLPNEVKILGALLGQLARGLENDVFCQVGLLMLVGLASKNAILIVEFANQLRERGHSIVDAAREAAEIRLRPISMTSLALILGIFPLVVATGAGQAARHSLGTAVVFGMIVSTLVNLYLIPVLYVGFETLRERFTRNRKAAHDDDEDEPTVHPNEPATSAAE